MIYYVQVEAIQALEGVYALKFEFVGRDKIENHNAISVPSPAKLSLRGEIPTNSSCNLEEQRWITDDRNTTLIVMVRPKLILRAFQQNLEEVMSKDFLG
jgi:hypothetical protein